MKGNCRRLLRICFSYGPILANPTLLNTSAVKTTQHVNYAKPVYSVSVIPLLIIK